MLATMVDMNGNVDYPVQSQTQQTKRLCPSIPLEERVCEAFYEWGLVEVLITVEDDQVWHDAYIIDVEKIPIEATKDGDTSSARNTAFTCTVALAVDGEDPFTTLTSQKNVHKCLLDQIRLKLKFDPNSNFAECDTVMLAMEPSPFICWKPVKIKMAKENFFVIEMINSKGDKSPTSTDCLASLDIVPRERLRPLTATYQLSEKINPFYRFALPLTQDLLQYVKNDFEWLSNFELHRDFKKYSGLVSVTVDRQKKALMCLAFASYNQSFFKDQVIKRCQMLISMHFNKLKDSYIFSGRMEAIQIEALNKIPKDFILNLAIERKYIGLAIGKGGVNIQKARHMEGIHSLDLDEKSSTFVIRGVSLEVCQAAAEILNYCDEKVTYPRDYCELFQERKMVEEIVSKSGIVKLELFTDIGRTDEIQLLIIGKPDSIENFKIMLNFQKAECDEINDLKYKHKILLQEIYNLQRHSGPLVPIANGFSVPRNFAEAVKAGMKC